MGKHFHCSDEIVIVSKGKEDIGKVPSLGNDGKLDPSVIPSVTPSVDNKVIAGAARAKVSTMVPYDVGGPLKVEEKIFDTGNFFNGDGKVHIPQDGIYLVTAEIDFQTNATGSRAVFIRKNGSTHIASGIIAPNATTNSTAANTSIVAYLQKGDILELYGACGGSASVSVGTIPATTQLSIARLGS